MDAHYSPVYSLVLGKEWFAVSGKMWQIAAGGPLWAMSIISGSDQLDRWLRKPEGILCCVGDGIVCGSVTRAEETLEGGGWKITLEALSTCLPLEARSHERNGI